MTVQNALNNFEETPLGYVRMIKYVEAGEAIERTLDQYSSREFLDCLQKQCSAYYMIGEYKYIVYKD